MFNLSSIIPLSFLFEGKKDLVVVEIGVGRGESTIYILDNFDIQMYYAIDPFKLYNGYHEGTIFNWFNKVGDDLCYEQVKEKLSKYKNVQLIRDFSHNAVRLFDDNIFDIVWIDGNHVFDYVYQDIMDWYPKVKDGGILSGDDSFNMEVMRAVRTAFDVEKYDIFVGSRSWFVQK